MVLKQFAVTMAAVASLSGLSTAAAIAGTVELQVSPLLSRTTNPNMSCPGKITLTQSHQPYREGSYGIAGLAKLDKIATNFAIAGSDAFSVTWVGILKPQYSQCQAAAGMVKVDGQPYEGHSYLRMRLMGGKAYLILDMTGIRDPNNYTTVIIKKAIENGAPTWIWGGSD